MLSVECLLTRSTISSWRDKSVLCLPRMSAKSIENIDADVIPALCTNWGFASVVGVFLGSKLLFLLLHYQSHRYCYNFHCPSNIHHYYLRNLWTKNWYPPILLNCWYNNCYSFWVQTKTSPTDSQCELRFEEVAHHLSLPNIFWVVQLVSFCAEVHSV